MRKLRTDGKATRQDVLFAKRMDVHGIPHLPAYPGSRGQSGVCILAVVVDVSVTALMERSASAWVAPGVDASANRGAWRRLGASQEWPAKARKAARLAVRTAYALGLARCAVVMQPDSSGVLSVARVLTKGVKSEPNFIWFRHEAAGNVNSDSAQDGQRLIGADPEFLLFAPDGTLVFADKFLPRRGTAGCDAAYIDGRRLYPLAEVRPAPAAEPFDLLRNTRRALRAAYSRIADQRLRWLAGGWPARGFPIGGHLHFSGIPLRGETLRTLDNYLALPLWMLEDEASCARRPRFGYLGDHKAKPHGGFEYRTPASWLVSPRIAAFAFALAKVVAEHWPELALRPLSSDEAAAAFYRGDKLALAGSVARIWQDLERTKTYQTFRSLLDPLKSRVLAGTAWDAERDLRFAWKLFDDLENAGAAKS